jgi:predicted amidohydrolase YtcJ
MYECMQLIHVYADFAILSADYLSVPDEQIPALESVLTVTGADVAPHAI